MESAATVLDHEDKNRGLGLKKAWPWPQRPLALASMPWSLVTCFCHSTAVKETGLKVALILCWLVPVLTVIISVEVTYCCCCCCCHDDPIRQCIYGKADAPKRWGIPPGCHCPGTHLWLVTGVNGVLLPILDRREVNVQLSPPQFHSEDRLET